jgi:hypothetical protein
MLTIKARFFINAKIASYTFDFKRGKENIQLIYIIVSQRLIINF